MSAIDIHVHHGWTKLAERPDYQLARTKDLSRQSGVGRVLLLTIGARTTPEELRERNDCTLRLAASDPEFFLPAMYLCAEHGEAAVKEEARRGAAAGMVAIKQLLLDPESGRAAGPVAEAAAELNLPILIHAWYNITEPLDKQLTAADVAGLAGHHRHTRFIMAHLTGVGRRGVQDVEDLPNVSVDTSGGWYDSEMIEYAVRHLGPDRVLFGSDFPGRDYAPQMGRVEGANLSSEIKEKILWRNAATALGLE